ncbi:unnamed protein product [Brachionus calyciflorus]|uniref:Dystrophin n=1 Tax=Brachionus calyciflorus TaxID=104777 RepID=A0A813N5V9_9BILA|nr:unnamed protein product [Brachionus calyciflorus]
MQNKDFVTICKKLLREIEELYVQEILLSENSSESYHEFSKVFTEPSSLKSHQYFSKLKHLACDVKDLEVKLSETECLFEKKEPCCESIMKTTNEIKDDISLNEANEFIKCVEKLLLSSETVDRHLDNIQRLNKEFLDFEKQELKLKAIKQTLESLTVALKTSLQHKKTITISSNKETSDTIDAIITKLTTLHQNVVKKFKEKNESFVKNSEKWTEFNTDFNSLQKWVQNASTRFKDINEETLENSQLKEIIKGVSNITENRLLLERININGHYILTRSSETEAKYLSEKLSIINQEWKCLIELLSQLKKKFVSSEDKTKDALGDNQIGESIETNSKWLDDCENLINRELTFNNEFNIEQILIELKAKNAEIINRKKIFQIEINQNNLKNNQNSEKVLQKYDKIIEKYETKRTEIEKFYKKFRHLKQYVNELTTWITNYKSNDSFLTELSFDEIKTKIDKYEKIRTTCKDLKQNVHSKIKLDQNLFKMIDNLDITWATIDLEKQLLEKSALESSIEISRKDQTDDTSQFVEHLSRKNQEFSDNEFSIINIIDNDKSISKVTLREDENNEKLNMDSEVNQVDLFCNELQDWLLWINHNLNNQIVTFGNFDDIQQSIKKYSTILEEVDKRQLKLETLMESKFSKETKEKLVSLEEQWKSNKEKLISFKKKLEMISAESKIIDEIFDNFSKHFIELEKKAHRQSDISFGETTLQRQKLDHNTITIDYEMLTKLYADLKEKYELICDKYSSDDLSKIEIKFSRIESRFRDLSDRLKLRGENLNQTSKIIFDFERNLENFCKWLEKIEKDLNYLEDFLSQSDESNMKAITDINKELQKEIENNSFNYSSLNQNSKKILESYKSTNEKQNLENRLDEINKKWDYLISKSIEIKTRLESNSNAECGAVLKSLIDLKSWCKSKECELNDMKKQVQPDVNLVAKLLEDANIFRSNVEFKKSLIENTLFTAKSHLKSQLSSELTNEPVLQSDDESESDIDKKDELTILKKINQKIKSLDLNWTDLNQNFSNYEQKIHSLYQTLTQLNKSFSNVAQKLDENETILDSLNSSIDHNEISDENQLTENLEKVKMFQISINTMQSNIEEMNNHFSNLNQDLQFFDQTNNLSLDLMQNIQNKYDDLNLRWSSLQQHIQEIYLHLYSLAETPESNIFFKLSGSVQPPWQRSISSNKIPYYINHSTEITTWDHPKMIELYKSFSSLNDIKFSAYRTAMKLRTLQKRLWLDYIDLSDSLSIFESLGTKIQNDKSLDSNQIVQCLNQIFQSSLKRNESQMIDTVLAIDMTLNWLLTVYDPSRCGQIKSISLKVALTLLSNGSIEDKYIYLFNLISDEKGNCSSKKLATLLYELIMIPKQLGEVAAFGGSNVEPSVKSCFEYAKANENIVLDQFLNWLKLEPQSIVWLPVLHRLAAAETARHEAKCSICKEYPIVGFRYRSLKHFNFDICQNCFFSGRKIKGFKFDHPLLEYYSPTSSSDDIKDFFKIFKNKFKSKRSRRSSKLGYLPVQTFLEGSDNQVDHENIEPILIDDLIRVVKDPEILKEANKSEPELPKKSPEIVRFEMQTNSKKATTQEHQTVTKEKFEKIEDSPKKKQHISFVDNEKSEDEHSIIAKICSTLYNETIKNNEKFTNEESFQQIELENMIKDLEEENTILLNEYNKLKIQLKSRDNVDDKNTLSNNDIDSYNKFPFAKSMSNFQINDGPIYDTLTRSYNPYPNNSIINRRTFSNYTDFNDFLNMTSDLNKDRLSLDKDTQVLLESNLIKQQDNKLEARMKILENHNRLLDAQLKSLKNLLTRKKNPNCFSPSNDTSIMSDHLNTPLSRRQIRSSFRDQARLDTLKSKLAHTSNRSSANNISTLFLNVEDITKAINNLNNLVNAMGVLDDNLLD